MVFPSIRHCCLFLLALVDAWAIIGTNMKRRWRITGLVILGALIISVIAGTIFHPFESESEYQRRKLPEWLTDYLRDRHTGPMLAIRRMGTNAVPYLVQMLHVKDSSSSLIQKCVDIMDRQPWINFHIRYAFQVHQDALRGLAVLGPDAKSAIPEIAKLLDQTWEYGDALETLRQIGPDAIPTLQQALTNMTNSNDFRTKMRNDLVRCEAAASLGLFRSHGEEVVPSLLTALKDREFLTKSATANSLSHFPKQADVIVPALIARLDDPDDTFRDNVADDLVAFGENARPVIPKLLKMIESADYNECTRLSKTLMDLDTQEALATFTKNLESAEAKVRRNSAIALMGFKSKGRPAVPALIICLKDPDKEVRVETTVALREIGEDLELVVPALMENLNDPDLELREITDIALRHLLDGLARTDPGAAAKFRKGRDPHYP